MSDDHLSNWYINYCKLKILFYLLFLICHQKYWTENYEAVLYQPYYYNSRYFRIPAITTAKDGTLVCATDMRWVNKNDLPARISVGVRRSLDDGFTWTENQIISGPPRDEGDGDPALVTDRKTGTIICMWSGEKGFFGSTQQEPEHIYVTRSFDNGLTWEPKRDITSSIYSNLCTNCSDDRRSWSGMFISSGAILQLRDGRIMAAGITRCWGQTRAYSVYSDDIGETWTASEFPASKTADESKFFERNDGVVVISVRHKPTRLFAFSRDRGMTWENETAMDDIWDSPCNGEVIRYTSTIDGYDKNRLIHTVTYVKNFPRRNVSVMLSYDEGKTWPIKKTLRGDPKLLGSYSTISIGHTGLIHVYYEKGTSDTDPDDFNMTVHTFSLEWLTDGSDTYKKAENLTWCVCQNENDNQCFNSCPDGFYHSTGQIFDQYVESYYEYPTNMNYVFPKGTPRDFSVDLGIPGLKKASYINSVDSKRPSVTFKNLNSIEDEEEAKEKLFNLTNIDAKINFDQFSLNKFILRKKSVLTINDTFNKIEVGKTKIRITKVYSKTPKSNTVDIEGTEATVDVMNKLVDANVPLEIYNGIEGLAGEEEASVALKITAAKPHTKIRINGIWKNQNGRKLITISSQGSNIGTKITTDSVNKDQFVVEGESPTFAYIYPSQTQTQAPIEPDFTSATSMVSDDIKDDTPNGENKINKTLLIVAIVAAVVAVCGIAAAVIIFVKMKKKNEINGFKSDKETNEALRSSLL